MGDFYAIFVYLNFSLINFFFKVTGGDNISWHMQRHGGPEQTLKYKQTILI